MQVIVHEYANDATLALTSTQLTVDSHSTVVNVGIESTAIIVKDLPLDLGVGQLNVVVRQGLQGPQGPAGAGVHQIYQLVDASSWSYTHPFSYQPEVRLVDVAGLGVDIGVEYPDSSSVYIEFPTPFTGTVILS